MKFVEAERIGEVLGNRVKAKPVPFSKLMEVGSAETAGDHAAFVRGMVEIVSASCTMEDGTPIDAHELSQNAVIELFKFATGAEPGGSDFTNAR